MASETVTRTIEIKADTRDAQRELARAEQALKEVTAELGALKAEGKASGEAQAALNQRLAEAKGRLDAAQASAAKASAGLARLKEEGKVSAKQIDRMAESLQRAQDRSNLAGQAARKASADIAKMGDEGQKTSRGIESMASSFGALRGAAVVGLVMEGAAAMREWANETAAFEVVQRTVPISIAKASQATKGLVNDYTLMVQASRAVRSGVVKDEEAFADLAEAAVKLGLSAGRDAKTSIEDLTTALATGQSDVLDNLGIVLKTSQAHDLYAEQLGKTTAELTDMEKAQAFAVIGLQKAQETAAALNLDLDTLNTSVVQATATWDNWSMTLKSWAVEGAAAAINGLNGIGTAAGDAMEDIINIGGPMETLAQTARRLAFVAQQQANEQSTNLQVLTEYAAEFGLTLEEVGQVDLTNLVESMERIKEAGFEEQPMLGPSKADFDAWKALEAERKKERTAAKKASDERKRARDAEEKEIERLISKIENSLDLEGTQRSVDEFLYEYEGRAIEQRLAIQAANIDQEIALLDLQLGQQEEGTDAYLALLDQKTAAEMARLEIERQTTEDSAKLIELETERKRLAFQNQVAHAKAAADKEKKIQADRERIITGASEKIAGVLGETAIAAIDASDDEERAWLKSMAGAIKAMRNTLIVTSIKEFALAAASAASYNFVGAAQHAAAGAQAAAGATAAAAIGAIAGAAAGGSESSAGGFRGGGAGAGAGSSAPEISDPNAGNEALDVPVSQDPNLRGVRTQPQQAQINQVILQGGTFIGTDPEQAGRELQRLLDAARGLN